MSYIENPVDKLHRHIKKNGAKGLLPQNLTNELLDRMLLEVDALERDETDEIPSSTLLLSILYLADPSADFNKKMEITIDPEELMEYFDLYMIAIMLEEKRRANEVKIAAASLPTIENIFDQNRKIEIE